MNIHETNSPRCISCAKPLPVGGLVDMQLAVRDRDTDLWQIHQVGDYFANNGMVWDDDEMTPELSTNNYPVIESDVIVFSPSDDAALLLQHAGEAWSRAREVERMAAAGVQAIIRHAVESGMSEVQAAKIAGVDRMTVRRALGKL
jgi:hypothetical protein